VDRIQALLLREAHHLLHHISVHLVREIQELLISRESKTQRCPKRHPPDQRHDVHEYAEKVMCDSSEGTEEADYSNGKAASTY
jgi:hypothetical protein